jgi:hypothetical protein
MGLSFAKCPHCFFSFSALAPLLAVGCGYWRIAARKTFYVGGPKRRQSGEARVAKTSVVTAAAGLEMQPSAASTLRATANRRITSSKAVMPLLLCQIICF